MSDNSFYELKNRSLYARLKRLFSNDVVVRNIGGKKLKVVDTDEVQYATDRNSLRDRFNRLRSTSYNEYSRDFNLSYQANRTELFRDYDTMSMDPILASALDIYADECTSKNEMGEIISIKSNNDEIKNILNNLFYDILNIEFNLWSWTRSLVKYGDFYLRLHISPEYGVYLVEPLSTYYVTRVENLELTNRNFVKFNVNMPYGNSIEDLENYEMAHFRLLSDSNFLPYGQSMLEGARRVWKQLSLMEDAMLIHRIMRAPEKRIFKIDIGNIPPNEVDNHMERIITQMKKVPYMDETTGDYNLRFNLQNMVEDFFLPVRGSDSGTEIDNLSGLEWTGTEDIEYLRNKMMAALKIPKAFLGYEENLCISPDTEIPLLNGEIKTVSELIADYENGIKNYTYSIDENTHNIVPGEIEWAGYTRMNTEVVRVHLDNGKYIDCTPDHLFMGRNGDWIEAQNLEQNQSLMPLYLDKTNKKNMKGYTTVYNPATDSYKILHQLVSEYYGKKVNRIFEYNNIDYKVNFVEQYTPLAKSNKGFMNNMVSRQNHKVLKVEFLSKKIDTCDLTIKDHHNFATNAGVIIHNSGKATLAAEDIRFARTIQRIQRIMLSELNKIAVVHLYSQGYRDESLVDFELELTNPSTIFEKEKIEIWQSKIDLCKDLQETKLFSKKWAYDKIFSLSDQDMISLQKQVVDDAKNNYRLKLIEEEGNDPALDFLKKKDEEGDGEGSDSGGEIDLGEPSKGEPLKERDQSGRKNARDYPFGEDPLGTLENNSDSDLSVSHSFKDGTPLSLESYKSLVDSLDDSNINKKEIINEEITENTSSYMDEVNIKE